MIKETLNVLKNKKLLLLHAVRIFLGKVCEMPKLFIDEEW